MLKMGVEETSVVTTVQTSVPQTQVSSAPFPTVASNVSDDLEPAAAVLGETVKSPIVGVFYEAPGPDKPVFVKDGDKVKKGDVLCIVEAMKVMNEIVAEKDCKIVKVLCNNEDIVEYGQPLFEIEAV